MDEKTSAGVKEFLLFQWIDALSLKGEDERLIKGVEWLKNGHLEEVLERFRHLSSQYREEIEKARQEARTRLEEALKREGIAGSAIEPNVEGNPLWKEACRKIGSPLWRKTGGDQETVEEPINKDKNSGV